MTASRKILVVRVGRAGDIVMITAALRRLLARDPTAGVHVLTSSDGNRVLRDFDPRVTRILLYDRKSLTEVFRRRALRRMIRAEAYDDIYCFELNPSYQNLWRDSGATVHTVQNSSAAINYAVRCLRVVDPDYDESREPQWVQLPVTAAGREKARALLQQAGVEDDAFIVGLHPSFSGLSKSWIRSLVHRRQKAWPAESYGTLAKLLTDHAAQRGIKLRVILDMLPEDRAIGEKVVDASGDRITLLAAPPDFDRYKAVLARMDLLLAPNTGPMHIASAVGTNVVALFAGLDPRDCAPYVPTSRVALLRAEDSPNPELGLGAISAPQAFAACRRYLPQVAATRSKGSTV
ncbi:MAG TPA: glycosyltransferase family 9 protein [Burkholderiales bacterium]